MRLHAGDQRLLGNLQKPVLEVADDGDGPFHEVVDLIEQSVRDSRGASFRLAELPSCLPDPFAPGLLVRFHAGCLEHREIVVRPGHRVRPGRMYAMPACRTPRLAAEQPARQGVIPMQYQ
jgi:hypothetical protein